MHALIRREAHLNGIMECDVHAAAAADLIRGRSSGPVPKTGKGSIVNPIPDFVSGLTGQLYLSSRGWGCSVISTLDDLSVLI